MKEAKCFKGGDIPLHFQLGNSIPLFSGGPDRDVAAAFQAWVITLAFLRVRIADDPRHPWL